MRLSRGEAEARASQPASQLVEGQHAEDVSENEAEKEQEEDSSLDRPRVLATGVSAEGALNDSIDDLLATVGADIASGRLAIARAAAADPEVIDLCQD